MRSYQFTPSWHVMARIPSARRRLMIEQRERDAVLHHMPVGGFCLSER